MKKTIQKLCKGVGIILAIGAVTYVVKCIVDKNKRENQSDDNFDDGYFDDEDDFFDDDEDDDGGYDDYDVGLRHGYQDALKAYVINGHYTGTLPFLCGLLDGYRHIVKTHPIHTSTEDIPEPDMSAHTYTEDMDADTLAMESVFDETEDDTESDNLTQEDYDAIDSLSLEDFNDEDVCNANCDFDCEACLSALDEDA